MRFLGQVLALESFSALTVPVSLLQTWETLFFSDLLFFHKRLHLKYLSSHISGFPFLPPLIGHLLYLGGKEGGSMLIQQYCWGKNIKMDKGISQWYKYLHTTSLCSGALVYVYMQVKRTEIEFEQLLITQDILCQKIGEGFSLCFLRLWE